MDSDLMDGELIQHCSMEYVRRHPGEAAEVLQPRSEGDVASVLLGVSPDIAEDLLRRMTPDRAAAALAALPDGVAGAILTGGDFVQMARWLSQCDPTERGRLLGLLPEGLARDVESAEEYPPRSAGRLMDPRFLTFRKEASVEEVLSRIRGLMGRRIADVLITDPEGRLTGTVSLQQLVGASPDSPIGSLSEDDPVRVSPIATQDEVVELMRTHSLASLPVVDHGAVLIGVLRQAALVQAAQSQAHGDLQQMVGVSEEERALSSPLSAIKSRLPWLLVNLLTAFVASAVVGWFDEIIARFTALAVLMPVVAGQSGNTGAQALAVTSRGLALREVRVGHWLRVVFKELIAALGNGIPVSLVAGLGVFVWSGSSGLMAVIVLAMIVSMLAAALAGAAIPMLLTAMKRDPAVASSIILTTVTDVTGFFSFLGLATLLADWIG